jgi:hypothetical protein
MAHAAISSGMPHIEEQVNSIEQAVVENAGLTFDLAKTLIQSVCRTMLAERAISFDSADDLPKVFKTATANLPFLPTSLSGEPELRKSLARTLNGLHTAVHGICELRNKCGFASHGMDGSRPKLEAVQALLAAEAADTIVGFLHGVHMQDRLRPASHLAQYEENPEFNDYVDEVHEMIRIFEAEFKPSDVLFQLEPETYHVYLSEFAPETKPAVESNTKKGLP